MEKKNEYLPTRDNSKQQLEAPEMKKQRIEFATFSMDLENGGLVKL